MFAILRIEKIKSKLHLTNALKHNHRVIKPRAQFNQIDCRSYSHDYERAKMASSILLPKKIRSNGVYALEFMLTASPEYFAINSEIKRGLFDEKRTDAFEEQALKFLYDNFPEENFVSVQVHYDESTPHIHAIMIPLDSEKKLNARIFVGGSKHRMKEIQDTFHNYMKPLFLNRGKSSKRKHKTISEFYQEKSNKMKGCLQSFKQIIELYEQELTPLLNSIIKKEDITIIGENENAPSTNFKQNIERWRKSKDWQGLRNDKIGSDISKQRRQIKFW